MKLCAPLIIYILFCLIQILIDLLEGLFNTAFMKTVISIAVSGILYFLCSKDQLLIAWIIVLIPFLFMSFTTSILLYKLNLKRDLGKSCDDPYVKKTLLNNPRYKHGFTHEYKYTTTPVKVRFEPVRKCDEEKEKEEKLNDKSEYFFDSDPQYESFM
jgi:hypothetical protein